MSFFEELKRRNVLRVTLAYMVLSWLVLQVADVLFDALGHTEATVAFDTRSGRLTVEREGDLYAMNFPAQPPKPCVLPESLLEGLGATPSEVLAAEDYLAVFESEAQVRSLEPDFSKLRRLDLRGLIVTAPGDEFDFVSRFFAPRFGIDEDPVTGSAHCVLAPYWSGRLGRNRLRARQISRRGGEVICEMAGARVILRGGAITFMAGEITVRA